MAQPITAPDSPLEPIRRTSRTLRLFNGTYNMGAYYRKALRSNKTYTRFGMSPPTHPATHNGPPLRSSNARIQRGNEMPTLNKPHTEIATIIIIEGAANSSIDHLEAPKTSGTQQTPETPENTQNPQISLVTQAPQAPQALLALQASNPPTTTIAYKIHLDFLTHASPFFHAAFKGNFSEATTKTMTLTDVTPASFGIFQHYIYTKILPPSTSVQNLITCWSLADRFLMPALQDALLDAVNEHPQKAKELEELNYAEIWEARENGTILRAFLVEQVMQFCGNLGGGKEKYPVEMLLQMFNEMRVKCPALDTKTNKSDEKVMKRFYVDKEGKVKGNEKDDGVSGGKRPQRRRRSRY